MGDTLPNIVVPADSVVDIYDVSGIDVGTQISLKIIGNGEGKLYSGATLTGKPDNDTGFAPIYARAEFVNDEGDLGAFVWSQHGCTINIGVV
jgi:hypothetical protein